MNTQNQAGFTIIELMLTIAVAAVLLAVAVPSYTNTVLNNCLTAKTNQLVTAMQLARSTAVTYREDVLVGSISCQLDTASSNNTTHTPNANCNSGGLGADEYGEGVLVYRDLDGDGLADDAVEDLNNNGVLDAGEDLNANGRLDAEIIRQFNFNCAATMNAILGGTDVAARAAITYGPNGGADDTAVIRVCDTRDSADYVGREISLTTTGRPTTDSEYTCP